MEDDGFYHRNGEKVGFVISVSSGDQVRIDIAQIAAQQLSSVGIDVTVDIPTRKWTGMVRWPISSAGEVPLMRTIRTYKVFGTGKGANYSGYSKRFWPTVICSGRVRQTIPPHERKPMTDFRKFWQRIPPSLFSATSTPVM